MARRLTRFKLGWINVLVGRSKHSHNVLKGFVAWGDDGRLVDAHYEHHVQSELLDLSSGFAACLHVPSVDNGLDDFAIHISFRGDLLRKHIFLPLSPKKNSLSRSLVPLHDPLVRQLASVEAVVLGKIFSNISLRSPFPQLDAPINMKKCRLSCFSEKMLEKRPKENNLRHYRDRGWTRSHAMQRCRPALVTSQTLKSLFFRLKGV